jgi:hypothetical protein
MEKVAELDDERLVTRKELQQRGLAYSPTSFQRWEKDKKLTPVKPGGSRSSRVHYKLGEVRVFLGTRPRHAQ